MDGEFRRRATIEADALVALGVAMGISGAIATAHALNGDMGLAVVFTILFLMAVIGFSGRIQRWEGLWRSLDSSSHWD